MSRAVQLTRRRSQRRSRLTHFFGCNIWHILLDCIANGDRFKLRKIGQPCLVVSGVLDIFSVRNSYLLSERLPNAVLLTYPDSGHRSLFQFHESFTRQAPLSLRKTHSLRLIE